MAGAIARLFVQLGLNKAEFDQGATEAKGKTYDLAGEMQNATSASGLLEGAMKAAGAAGVAALAKEAIEAAFDLAMLSEEAARVGRAFTAVATGVGANGEAIAAAMDEATRRTVDDEALMQTATQGMIMGLRMGEDAWAALAAGARYHAKLIGQDTETVFAGIVDAVARGQPKMLQALSFPGARDAIYELAETMDSSVTSMSEAERQAILLQKVMEILSQEQAQFGPLPEDMIDSVDELERAWGDVKEEWGAAITKGGELAAVLNALAEAIGGATPHNLDEAFGLSAGAASRLEQIMLALTPVAWALSIANGQVTEEAERQEGAVGSLGGTIYYTAEALAAAEAAESELQAPLVAVNDGLTTQSDILQATVTKIVAFEAGFRRAGATLPGVTTALWNVAAALLNLNTLSSDELVSGIGSAGAQIQGILAGIGGADVGYLEQAMAGYEQQLNELAILAEEEKISPLEYEWRTNQIIDSAQEIADSYDDIATAAEDSVAAQNTSWDDLRSTVESALQATGVTAEDLAAAASGAYVDKWDEGVRRLNAVAQNGFAELQAHPDWASALEIPPDVLAGTEQQLKDWAERTAKAAPTTMFDIDAAVEMVEQFVAQQAAHDALVDEVTRRYAEKHGISQTAAKKKVGGALGDSEESGKTAADDMLSGFTKALGETSPVTVFVTALGKDVNENAGLLKTTGMQLWAAAEVGIQQQMNDSNYVMMFALKIAPVVARLLQNPWEN